MIVYSYIIVSAALAVTQGSTTPPSIREGSLPPRHSNASLLFTLLQVAGFSETCFSGVLDYCSSAQEEAHYPSLIQELQENKEELQEVKEQLQEVKEQLQEGKVKTQEVKEELQEGKVKTQEVKEMVQQELKGMMQLISKVAYKLKVLPRDCKDLLDSWDSESGLREVFPNPKRPDHPVNVYCEQDIDGGGWTVFQRRVNNSVREDFYRNWEHYQAGFGNINGEFWLGLDHLHELTSTEQELRVDLSDYEGQHRWAKYGIFQVGPEDTNYRLTVGRYSGDAEDSMAYHNGQQFSTHDADHDKAYSNCAERDRGAWWYKRCHYSNLNGYQYVGDNSPGGKGITWRHWRGWKYSLMRTTMMLRPAL